MIDYRLLRSSRRTLALEVTRDGEVLVRSPWRTPQETVDGFVKDHTAWILKNVARQKQRPKRHDPSPEEIAVLKQKAKDILPTTSNLHAFMDDYEVISEKTDPEGERPNAWRLFDMDDTGNVDDYPEDSSLRRAYKQYLKNGGSMGSGYGVFLASDKQFL